MAAKRELIKTRNDARFVRRDSSGQFQESDDVGRSLTADRRRKARTTSASGQGDRGDRATSSKPGTSSKRATSSKRTTSSKRATSSNRGSPAKRGRSR